MTTIRFNDGELERVKKGFNQMIDKDAWHFARPFWYKLGMHGTWEVYTAEEVNALTASGYMPKAYSQILTNMILRNG